MLAAAPAATAAGPTAQPAGPVGVGDPPPPAVAEASSGVVPPTPPPAGDAAGADAKGTKVESPSVGLFWRAPSPGAPPFVELGGRVAAGETVAIVEVMKLMNHVASPVDGVVTAILVENGEAVEFGQAIVVVDPEG
ncbi:MAG TPA: biotin/lipoyl-containing protein [Solirubrobacterales bacterium]